MIKIENSFLDSFRLKNIFKNDYISYHKLYNQDFEYFSRTIFSLSKNLNKFRNQDINLNIFLGFYGKFIKNCNSLPIALDECALLVEGKSKVNLHKVKSILSKAYPNYEHELDYIFKKYNEFKLSTVNLFLDNNNLTFDEKNIFLYDGIFSLKNNFKFIKKINYFKQINFKKITSVILLNPQIELLREIAYLDVCDYIKVYNFGWIKKNYDKLSFFISNKNIPIENLKTKTYESSRPYDNVENELKGEIFDEELLLSSDLDDLYEKLNAQNIEDDKIEDQELKNESQLDKIKATLFQLSNGKVALLRNDPAIDQSQDVLEKSPLGKISVKSKKVDFIKQGEFVLFQGERATTMLEKETAIFVSDAQMLYANRKDWKFRLKQEIIRLGLEKVIIKIKEYGGRKSTKVHNISYWLNPKSLKSKDKPTFLAIMKLCGLHNKSNEIWSDMEKLEKAHRKAGRIIRKKIEMVITKNTSELQEKGFQEYFLDDTGSGSVEVYKIIEKGKSLKVKLSLTDRAMLPKDLI